MQTQLTHICLHVENIEECVNFYRHYCQLEVIADRSSNGEGSIYMSDKDSPAGLVIQFMSGGKNRTQECSDETHFGFAVSSRERVDEVSGQARLDGILFFEPDEYIPGGYMCGVRDPDGNCVEFGFGHKVPPISP